MSSEDLIMSYWRSWQSQDWDGMRASLDANLSVSDGELELSGADDFVAMTRSGPRLQNVDLVRSEFGETSAALLYEADNVTDKVRVRSAEFYSVEDDAITSIQISWRVIGKLE